MTVFFQLLVGAVTLGAVYALIAYGWGIVLNVTGVLNVAHGELVVIAGLATATMVTAGVPLLLVLPAAILISLVLALGLEAIAVGGVPGSRNPIHVVLITLGMALMLAVVAENIFGSDPLIAKPLLSGPPIGVGQVTIPLRSIPVVIAALVLFAAFRWLNRSRIGRMMRACADSPQGARYCGIDTKRISRIAFGLAGIVAGITGFFFVTFTSLSAAVGLSLGLKGFVALVLAREDRTELALVGGFALAFIEAMVAGYISSRYQDSVAYIVLLVVLLGRAARAGHVPMPKFLARRPAVSATA